MLDILAELTTPQREAASHLDGPMLVVAGAGSGKTRVVTRRIAFLIGRGVPAWRILALTFTNKAAREMRERVEKLVGEAPAWLGTFHSVCARFLRRDIQLLDNGRDRQFSILDRADQESLMRPILKSLGRTGAESRPAAVLSRISALKSGLTAPGEFRPESGLDEATAPAYAEYEKALRAQNALDFDDLLILAVRLLETSPATLAKYRAYFPYLLVDEYQDTNRAQYLLLRLLAGESRNLHATGDPDQSIYSWRGADYRNIMDFQSDFPGAKLVRLEENYRSGRHILEAANHLIRHNRRRLAKDLFTSRPGGEKVRLVRLQSDRQEARWIGEEAARLIAGGAGGVAIFYRTNAQSRQLEEALVHLSIPYQLVGGVRFYERREVKDLLAHLRLRVNPRDRASFRRAAAARPGVGARTVEKLEAAADAAGRPVLSFVADPDFPRRFREGGRKAADLGRWAAGLAAVDAGRADEAVKAILAHSGLIEALFASAERDDPAGERLENLHSLVARAGEFTRQRLAAAARPAADGEEGAPAADLAAFLEDVALVADVDGLADDSSRVTLMTLHSAKGLEFDQVFIAGLEEGLLPHHGARDEAGWEEERRLFYVGLTRARERAWLSHAACRSLYGGMEVQTPSRFLDELPASALEESDYGNAYSWEYGGGLPTRGRGEDAEKAAGPDSLFDVGADFDPNPDFQPDPDPGAGGLAGPGRKRSLGAPARPGSAASGPAGRFKVGDLVRHPGFGSGKILSAERRAVMVQFFSSGVRILPWDLAQLTPE